MISENIELKARILRFLKTCFPSVRKEVSNWPKCSFRLLRKLLWEYPTWSLKTQANFLAKPIVSWLLSLWFFFFVGFFFFFLLLGFVLGPSARTRWLGRSFLRILVSWVAITDDHQLGKLMQQKHCLIVLEALSLPSRCSQGWLLLRALTGKLLHASPPASGPSRASLVPWLVDASCQSLLPS